VSTGSLDGRLAGQALQGTPDGVPPQADRSTGEGQILMRELLEKLLVLRMALAAAFEVADRYVFAGWIDDLAEMKKGEL
jgi:hypothetical protein